MRMEARLQARQTQEMRLAPQMIQSMEILQLPLMDLQAKVAQELEENPALELKEGGGAPEIAPAAPAETDREPDDEGAWFEELSRWREGGARRGAGGDDDAKFEMLQNTVARPQSLQDHLRDQLRLLDVPAGYEEAAEQIIYNLDDAGYLPYTLEQVREASADASLTLEQLEGALRIVQSLDPAGVGARDLKECLLLQLRGDDSADADLARDLIRGHLADLEENRLPKIAKAMGRDLEEIKRAVRMISTLNPRPGALYGGAASPRIVPDVVVESVDGRYEVRVENHYIPRLAVSPWHRERLEKSAGDASLKEWLRKKIDAAKWLIEAIVQRQDTLQRVATAIVEAQKGFLDHGIERLAPLKMQQIADQVGVHVSTVSRAISKKYIQTPRGIFPMKFFFSGGVRDAGGEEGESWVVVRQKVAELVAQEDKRAPLSDGEIAEALKKQGLAVARRTVAKYRKMLNIGSSRMRRAY